MKILRPGVDPETFLSGLARAPSRVLMLDYDGTLAPFREERDQAVPYPGVRRVLESLLDGARTRLVVVSGRAIEDLRALLGVEPPPELWGTHGWERLRPGRGLERAEPSARARKALADARREALERAPADAVEVKPVSVAVHTRGREGGVAERLVAEVREAWRSSAGAGGLEIHDFDGGVELRVPGRDKGTAVREIIEPEPEGVAAAYLGDDRTDEDAFHALEGRGLRLLVRPELRETAADAWIRPPDELLDFLERWNREAAKA